MKKIFRIVLVLNIVLALMLVPGKTRSQTVAASISYQNFYDGLTPYGTWIDYPNYGHVWHPKIDGEFRPYLTNGHWRYTTDGWLWDSGYDWGWATFHYGRWIYDDLYGWLWIPGYEWSPAWVTWGSFDEYYAWAPLMPEVYVGLSFEHWRPAAFYWNVCNRNYIYDRDVYSHMVERNVVNVNINRINIINNFNSTKVHNQYYSRGPQVEEVQKFTGKHIDAVKIREVKSPAAVSHKDTEIGVYRPPIDHPHPKEFRRLDRNEPAPPKVDNDHFNTGREQQQQNIERMPMHRFPEQMPVRGGKRGPRI
ncbi:MAG: hypothetical protein DI535_09250 [Citrobacter freundii]|nr:MAG: hypothetical protein DI535_09250 [Citrobacter freundii]